MGSLFLSAAAALSIVFTNVVIVELCGTADEITPTQPRNVNPESYHATHECFKLFIGPKRSASWLYHVTKDSIQSESRAPQPVCNFMYE